MHKELTTSVMLLAAAACRESSPGSVIDFFFMYTVTPPLSMTAPPPNAPCWQKMSVPDCQLYLCPVNCNTTANKHPAPSEQLYPSPHTTGETSFTSGE
jgi:hypothetical protein